MMTGRMIKDVGTHTVVFADEGEGQTSEAEGEDKSSALGPLLVD